MEILNFLFKKNENPQELLDEITDKIELLDEQIKNENEKYKKLKKEKGEVPISFEVENFKTILNWRIYQIKKYFAQSGYEKRDMFEFWRKPNREDNVITGMSYYDDYFRDRDYYLNNKHPYKKVKVEYISQVEYFKRCAKARGQFSEYNITREFLAIEPNNIKRIDKLYQKGELYYGDKFPIGVIDYPEKTQEGRHRTLLSYKYGLEKVPVLMVYKKDI